MDTAYINNAAKEIYNTIRTTVPHRIRWCWAARAYRATVIDDMPAVQSRVSGRLHKGHVIVAYDAGADYFCVYLKKIGKAPVRILEDVDFEELGGQIDRHIERGDNPDEYNKFCENALSDLFRGKTK